MPDESVFGPAPGWQMPHIYHEQEIVDLLISVQKYPGFRGKQRPKRTTPMC
jgi:hypothetical protein